MSQITRVVGRHNNVLTENYGVNEQARAIAMQKHGINASKVFLHDYRALTIIGRYSKTTAAGAMGGLAVIK